MIKTFPKKMELYKNTYHISKYIGKFPEGYWDFVEEFKGTYSNANKRIINLQKKDKKNKYRFWDCR